MLLRDLVLALSRKYEIDRFGRSAELVTETWLVASVTSASSGAPRRRESPVEEGSTQRVVD
jgi:hypothetical protein